MGRSKFPGKPTKLVNKKRISVLSGNSTNSDNFVNNGDDEFDTNDLTSFSNNDNNSMWSNSFNNGLITTEAVSKSAFNNNGDHNIQRIIDSTSSEQSSSDSSNISSNVDKVNSSVDNMKEEDQISMRSGVQTRARSYTSLNNTKTTITKEEKKLKKKTVTFKNILETSDDITEKKVYNPDNAPLVPIIKKECLNRSSRFIKSECLVRPSRLTEILKNNENNIDKLNSITFRTTSLTTGIALSNLTSLVPLPSSDVVVMGDKRFILPKRSVHSCRVIKPNKRFLDGMDDTYNKKHLKKLMNKQHLKNNDDDCDSTKDDREYDEDDDDDEEDDEDEESEISKSVSEDEESDVLENETVLSEKKFSSSSVMGKVILREPKLQFHASTSLSNVRENDGPFSFKASTSTINRLNVVTPSLSACKICGTISSQFGLDQNTRKFGVITCEACRRFISKMIKKLAVSSSTLNSTSVENTSNSIECIKKDGTCAITPMLRNNSLKPLRKTFKDRCHVCWLKKCLKTFQIPSGLRTRLLSTLPTSLKDLDHNTNSAKSPLSPFSIKKETTDNSTNIFSTPPTGSRLLSWPQDCVEMDFKTSKILSITNPLTENNATFGGSPLIKPNILENPVFMMTSIAETIKTDMKESSSKISSGNLAKAVILQENTEKSKIVTEEQTSTRCKTRKKEPAVTSIRPSTPVFAEQTKRQRIDLKGPRVKHVCRSASIVLGQPIATFSSESALENLDTPPRPDSPNTEIVIPQPDIPTQSSDCSNCVPELGLSPPATPVQNTVDEVEPHKEIVKEATIEIIKTNEIIKENSLHKLEENQKPLTRKLARPGLLSTSQNISNIINRNNMNITNKKPQAITVQPPHQISIDFWENYDPAEVSRTGFGLMVTEPIPLRALCFLCGSSGLDKMMFCVCCCEPYHQYCVEDEYNLRQPSLDDSSFMDISIINSSNQVSQLQMRLNWLCPRCTVCYTCNMSSGSKLKCQKCQKNYHSTCLGTSKRLLGADRPLICANCLKCKSCGTTNVNKFVGNLPMCHTCFKLRQRGNFCPLCQKCYEENDFDLKMMECGDCKRWVHAKCEGVPDEQYNMLSALPENIEFICKKCSKNPSADIWREAVLNEFKTGLLSVIKLLSKSRQACALLKLSPRKKSSNCVCQPMVANRSIQFTKIESQHNENNDNISMENENNIVCYCENNQQVPNGMYVTTTVPSLLDIKRKINSGEYFSVQDFNYDMQLVINAINCDDLSTTYKEILSETFPWFQNETKACTDALVEDMYDSSSFNEENHSVVEMDQEVPMIDIPEDNDDYFYSGYEKDDDRMCMFCKGIGEGISTNESRLLYCGHNVWVHTNCALWSAEVFEEIDGSLQNVHSAISRGRMIKCSNCNNKGATVGCNVKNCGEHFHYPCARIVGCAFMLDKTVFCPQHLYESDNKNCQTEKNFEVLRPVYVELDRRKKKIIEPSKIQFLIGSLYVKKIGKFIPILSDNSEAIIPAEYQCTRLYWSSKEPWKIVEYTVKTTVQNNSIGQSLDTGRNFTVDHSNNPNFVQFGLAQIQKWHNTLLNGDEFEFLIQSHLKNNEENNEEEPQNNADLLPPEIKDVIFEDLPHDLLDGISMLDILPKLMTYEDLVAMDMKNEAYFGGDLLKEGKEDLCDEDMDKNCVDNSDWNNTSLVHFEDPMLLSGRSTACNSRELKRSKSEIFSRGIAGNRSHQRSCSLTWSCKFDANAAVKRRKVSMFQELKLPENVLLSFGRNSDVKYPGNVCERRLSLQNEESKPNRSVTWTATKKLITNNDSVVENENNSVQREVMDRIKISQLDGVDDLSGSETSSPPYDNSTQHIYNIQLHNDIPVTCDRCHCTYRTQDSYKRHLNSCEPMSTSDSDSETLSPDRESINQHNGMIVSGPQEIHFSTNSIQPFLTTQSNNHQNNGFQFIPQNVLQGSIPISNMQNTNHMQNTIPLRTATSMQNTIPISAANLQTQINQNMANMIFSNGQTQNSQQSQTQQIFTQSIPVNNFSQQIFPLQSTSGINQFNNQPQVIQTASSLGVPQAITMPGGLNLSNFNNQQLIQQPQNQYIQIATSSGPQLVAIAPQQLKTSTNTNQFISNSPNKNQLILPQPSDNKSNKKQKKITAPRGKAKNIVNSKPLSMKQQRFIRPEQKPIQIINSNVPMIRPNNPTTQNVMFQSPTQPILVQQMGNNTNNLVQYVTDGHNTMQYIAMPTSNNDFKQQQQPQYITPTTTLVPGTFQLQTDSGGNLVLANTPTGLSVLPIAQPQQPQVIGTILQPQATTVQCGMMATEQMMLGSTPTLEMVTDPSSGCMYLTSQPVYFGLETIVRNTVMSSQQFVSTAMQGVLSQNSSFSATTTQVFQASKIEPIMEVPSGYVVLNNDVNQLNMMPQVNSQQNILSNNILQQPTIQQIPNTPQIQPQPAWRFIKDENTIQSPPQIIQPAQPRPMSPVKHQNTTQPQMINKVLPSNKQNQNVFIPEQKKSIILPKISVADQNILSHYKVPSQSHNNNNINTPTITNTTNITPIQIKPNSSTSKSVSVKPKLIAKPVSLNKISNINANVKSSQSSNTNIASHTTHVPTSTQSHSIIVPLSQQQLQEQQQDKQNIQEFVHQFHQNETEIDVEKVNMQSINTAALNHISMVQSNPTAESITTTTHKEISIEPQTSISITVPQVPPTIMFPQQNANLFQPQNANANTSTSQTTSISLPISSSIQLPTAPYAPPHHSNGIPTNVVNPIQQHHHNNSNSSNNNTNNSNNNISISRPTNRVLPMQTVLQKLSPPTPPEPKLHIETDNEKFQLNEIKEQDQLSDLSPNLIIAEKDQSIENEEDESSLDEESKFENYLKEKKNNDEVFSTVNSNIITDNSKDNIKHENLNKLNNQPINSIMLIEDKDDSNDRDENIEVKEQISKILVNLENDEFNNKSNILEDDENYNSKNNILENTESITSDYKILNVQTDDDINQKENIEPIHENINEDISFKYKISEPHLKSSSFQKPTGPHMLYEIQSQDGFTYKSTSISEIWNKVFEAVQLARKAHGLTSLPEGPLSEMSGYQMLGLKTNAIKYLLEQLSGVEKCVKYIPKYHKKDKETIQMHNLNNVGYGDELEDLTENQYGAARCEPYSSRSGFDMFSWLASRHRKQPALVVVQSDSEITIPRRGSGSLPMAMRYRTLKEKSTKDYVGVFRSHIHGRGLFCTRDIEAGEMVIEYAGERIRSILTDKREKYYDSKGIGCYMFKMDENAVVDATMRGSAARFINHSCEPNCYSKVVDISGEKHIIIFALRRIVEGEELTYDYKFPLEDEKILCSCGSKRCRKYLN